MAKDGITIIKKVKKGGHDGHHGGAWKVAYADFVTAMMAFFLLMWLINTTTPEQKRGIADYFAAQSISQSTSGAGGVLGGTVLGPKGARAQGAMSIHQKQAPPAPPADQDHHKGQSKAQGGDTQTKGTSPASQEHSDEDLQRAMHSTQNGEFESAAESIRQAMKSMPDIAAVSRQVIMDQTPKGMRIQLVDQDGRSMFEPGTASLKPYARKLLETVAAVIDRLPNRIIISGHTDGKPFQGPAGTTNWELSADRANAARRILTASGVSNDQIYEVAGKAGSEPLLPEDPDAPSNRRISIVLLKEAPPVPPNHQL